MATFKRLQELGEDVVSQVDTMLLNGETPTRVARWIQNDLELLPDLKESSLKKNLERYRSQELRKRVVDEMADRASGKSVAGVRKQLIALDEMNDTAVLQKTRVEKVLMREKQLPEGVVMKQANEEMRLLKDILVELGKLQLETGVMRRAPKTVSGEVTDPETGQSRQFTWTEEQEELFKQIEHMPSLDGEIEDAEEIPDR